MADRAKSADRLREIRGWRARFSVHPDLAHVGREEGIASPTGQVPVFQHTLDDYDFLLAEIDRLRAQNKESGDAWSRRTAKLQSDYDQIVGLHQWASSMATKIHNEGRCPLCGQAHTQGPIASSSRFAAALVALAEIDTLKARLAVAETVVEAAEGLVAAAGVNVNDPGSDFPEELALYAALAKFREVAG